MRLKERMKTYNFWVSLASAVLLIINTLGKKFDFSVDEKMYNDLLSSFCGILVLLGIIVPPSNSEKLISSKGNKNITIEIFDDKSAEINIEDEDTNKADETGKVVEAIKADETGKIEIIKADENFENVELKEVVEISENVAKTKDFEMDENLKAVSQSVQSKRDDHQK